MKDFLQRIEKLSPKHLALLAVDQQRRLDSLERSIREPVAIVGMGCRFPGGADGPDAFWELLLARRDAITEVPLERWDGNALYDPDPEAPGKVASRWGGFLDGIEQFDAPFFGISRREANSMDPQQRLLLETSVEALEHAGVAASGLAGKPVGIFFGLSTADYHQLLLQAGREAIDGYTATGSSHSVAAGRIAYMLGLHGPNLAVDTACSSSLVALHLACHSLRAGECELALSGGANLILTPETSIALSRARLLAPDGRSKAFDASADGFVRSEGCGVVVLKLLSRAVEDSDHIIAVIRGSAVNQDGRSSGLTAPNGAAQEAVLRQAMQAAGVKPSSIQYVEAHGTGTSLGDPIEAHALATVLGRDRSSGNPLYVGSVKTNIGHLESAAGIAGVIKAALCLYHGTIPPSLHFSRLNPHIDLNGAPLIVPVEAVAWPVTGGPRMAGVSSFGFSGTNAHVILEEPPPRSPAPEEPRDAHVLVLSARTPAALRSLARRYEAYLAAHLDVSLHDLCFTADTGRSRHEVVIALRATHIEELRQKLHRVAEGVEVPGESTSPGYVAGNRLALPTYPFERQRYWFKESAPAALDLYRLEWEQKPLPQPVQTLPAGIVEMANELAPQFRSLSREHGLDEFAELRPEMDRVSCDFIVGALLEMGWHPVTGETFTAEGLAEQLSVKPRFWRSFGRMLEILAEQELLEPGHPGWTTRRVPQAANPCRDCDLLKAAYPQFRGELTFLRRCGKDLASVLQGVVDPLTLLFPDGSFETAEDLYERSAGARVFQTLIEQAIAHRCRRIPGGSKIRILEIGAGTGGTATYVARSLDPARTEYVFTDVSPLFAARAAEKFRNYPFFLFKLLDIEQDPKSQGFAPHSFDIVIASNALHATTDLRRSIKHAVQLLVPGGLLVLLEGTRSERWVDVSFGLTEGWWKFVDHDLRQTYPLVPRETWIQILAETGCRDIHAVPPDHSSQQVLLLARAPESAQPRRSWTLVGAGEFTESVAARLRAQSCTVTVVPDLPAVMDESPSHGILDLRPLDMPSPEKLDDPGWSGTPRFGCEPLLALCRAAKGNGNRIWAITRGAQRVIGDDLTTPLAAPVWGLGRSIALEQPEAWGGLIDLDPRASTDDQADMLVREVLSYEGEDEVAFRGGKRYLARLRSLPRPVPQPIRFREDASYLITGGLGGLGLLIASWMAGQGARRLILVSRAGVTTDAQAAAIRRIESSGASVRVVESDIADPAQVERLFDGLADEPPLRGVIHAAAVLSRDSIADMSVRRLRDVMRPKVAGTWLLHHYTRQLDLDFFCLFSSTASLLGSATMGHYAAANQFLDAFAHYRRQLGLPALSIAWGTWDEMRGVSQEDRRLYRSLGFLPIPSPTALAALGDLLARQPESAIVAAAVNWHTMKAAFEARRKRPLLESMDAVAEPLPKPAVLTEETSTLASQPPAERENRLRAIIWEETCRVLQMPVDGPMELDRGFFELGMDSLVSVELKSRLEARLGRPLPSMLTFNFPNVRALAARLAADFTGTAAQTQPAVPHVAVPEDDDEVARMLAEKLRQMHDKGVLSPT